MRSMTRVVALGAVILWQISCSGTAPVEEPPTPESASQWRPVPIEGAEPTPEPVEGGAAPTLDPEASGPTVVEAPAEPSPLAGARVVAARLLDAPAEIEIVEGFKGVRLDEEGLVEVSYPYPFNSATGALEPLLRRLVTVDRRTRSFDMRTGLILPAGAVLRWELPAGEGRVLHFAAASFHRAFRGRGADTVKLEVLVDDEPIWQRELPGRESSTGWDPGEVILPAAAKTVTVRVVSPKGVGLKPGAGLADILVSMPASDASAAPVRMRSGPNVVVIFVDALRSDCVGPGNPGFPSVTEFLDERAATGTTYTHNFTVSNQTRASIVGFLQSQHPTVGRFHAKWWNFRKEKVAAYYERRPPLLPLLLARCGYETVTFGRNHFQFGTTLLGLDPGYDRVWDNRKSQEDTERIIDSAIDWLDGVGERKFMLLVNISPPHQPYKAPDEHVTWTEARLAKYEGRLPARKDYLAEVRYADVAVRRLVEHMDSLNLSQRTVFVVTADHGEVMRDEHSCKSALFETICHNSHGLTLYDEELRVPLIWWGWGVEPGVVQEHTVSHLDAAPTILGAAGLPAHPAHTGLTLWGELRGEESAADRPDVIYVETRLSSALRAWGWKYILHHRKDDARTPAWNSGGNSGEEELYDVTKDPRETVNLVRRQEPRRRQFRQLLKETRTLYKDYVDQAWDDAWNPEAAPKRTNPPVPGVPLPATPAPSTSEQIEPSGDALYHLVFSGGGPDTHRFEGAIQVEGRIADARFLGPDGAFRLTPTRDGIKVGLDVWPGEEVGLRLRTLPGDAAVTLALEADGAPLESSRVYAGRDGLALLDTPAWGPAEATSLLHTRTPPHRIPGEDLGVFVWRTGRRDGCDEVNTFYDGDVEKERIVDPATRSILRDYGYWK